MADAAVGFLTKNSHLVVDLASLPWSKSVHRVVLQNADRHSYCRVFRQRISRARLCGRGLLRAVTVPLAAEQGQEGMGAVPVHRMARTPFALAQS